MVSCHGSLSIQGNLLSFFANNFCSRICIEGVFGLCQLLSHFMQRWSGRMQSLPWPVWWYPTILTIFGHWYVLGCALISKMTPGALPAAVLTVQSSASCRQHLDYFSLDAFPCIYLCWKVTDLPFFCSLIQFCEVSLKYFSIIVALDCPKLLVYLVLLAFGLLFLVFKYIFYNTEWNSTGWKGISCCCWWQ